MTNKTNRFTKMRMLLALTAIVALCIALPVRSALPYATASNVSQLGADIYYADTNGGTYIIYLQPNTSFTNLLGLEWFVDGVKTVNLTIAGNGDTFYGSGPAAQTTTCFFTVAAGSSLTLEQMSLQGGYADESFGGALHNSGTLMISNCTLSANGAYDESDAGYDNGYGGGGAIFNSGTLIIENSIVSDNSCTGFNPLGGAIYNKSGTVKISNSTLNNNWAVGTEDLESGVGGAVYNDGGTITISHSSLVDNSAGVWGGGIATTLTNSTVTVENSSKISGNTPDDVNGGTVYLDSSSEIGILDANAIFIVQGSGPSPSPRIFLSTSNAVVISWPYPSNGWSLQQNSELRTTNWVTSTNTVANDGTNNFIIAAPSLDHLFFRLKF